MAFRPENPEFPEDLYVLCDPEKDAVFVLYYEPGNELFYRDEGQWKEITEEDEWEFDLDGLIDFNVNPAFIELYDKADAEDYAISIEDVLKYESTELEETE
jgi:hypothetical protein